MLLPITQETLALLAGLEADSVNAYGLSKLATAGQPGSEWRRTFEFTEAIEQLVELGLVWLPEGQEPHGIPPETWHYQFDRRRCADSLALGRLAEERVLRPLRLGIRLRLSPLAARL